MNIFSGQYRFSKRTVWMTIAMLMSVSSTAAAGLFEESVSGQVSTSSENIITPDTPTEGEGGESVEGEAPEAGAASEMTADDETADATEEVPTQTIVERVVERSGLSFDFNGHIRGDVFAGKMPDYSRGVVKSGYGELGLRLRVSKGSYGDAFGEVRFQGGYFGDEHYLGQPSRIPNKGTDLGEFDTRVKLREAYVNAYIGPLDLRFGKQIIVWGRADGINPTNNLTLQKTRRPLRALQQMRRRLTR